MKLKKDGQIEFTAIEDTKDRMLKVFEKININENWKMDLIKEYLGKVRHSSF